jgi:ribonuclease P protein component
MQSDFPKSRRLLRSDQFDRVFSVRQSRSDKCIVVYACRNKIGTARLGLAVSKKCGNAIRRNTWKRRLREAFRRRQQELPKGIDLVVIPRPGSTASVEQLQCSLVRLAGILDQRLAFSEAEARKTGIRH